MQARRHLKPIKKQVRRNRLRDGAISKPMHVMLLHRLKTALVMAAQAYFEGLEARLAGLRQEERC
jgi:hypothetical protein